MSRNLTGTEHVGLWKVSHTGIQETQTRVAQFTECIYWRIFHFAKFLQKLEDPLIDNQTHYA